jgi:VCBS repeat-containing protein
VKDGVSGALEDSAPVVFDALSIASDVDQRAALKVVDLPANLPDGVSFNAQTHLFSFDASHAKYQYLAMGEVLSVPVKFGISDGTTTTTATVTFKVTGVNDAPVAVAATNLAT